MDGVLKTKEARASHTALAGPCEKVGIAFAMEGMNKDTQSTSEVTDDVLTLIERLREQSENMDESLRKMNILLGNGVAVTEYETAYRAPRLPSEEQDTHSLQM